MSFALLWLFVFATSTYCQPKQKDAAKTRDESPPEANTAGSTQAESESTADAPKRFTKILNRTQFTAHRFQAVLTLVANVGGKTIPLEGKTISASLQYLDGKPKPVDLAKTDEDGVVRFEFPSRKDKLPNTYFVFTFAGDTSHLPAEAKSKLK